VVRLLADGSRLGTAVDSGTLRAVGWATVDLDRTASRLHWVAFGQAGEEPALGARTVRARLGNVELVLLEPSTEGRLAGWLARNGEGVAVLYVEASAGAGAPGKPTALGRVGRLQPATDQTRPFVIALDPGDRPTSAPSGESRPP
jgi:hypothetical protein